MIHLLNYLWYRADKLRRTVCIEFPKSLKYGIIANKRIYHDFVFCATESDYHVISLFLKTNLNMLSVWFRNRNLYNQKKNYITENLWKKNVKLIYMSFTQWKLIEWQHEIVAHCIENSMKKSSNNTCQMASNAIAAV